jgi:DNA-3-methyladenine glycosylase II
MPTLKLKLLIIPPFRLDFTVWALRRRSRNIVDRWDGRFYSRILNIENTTIKVVIEQIAEDQISLTASSCHPIAGLQPKIVQTVKWMLALDVDLTAFYTQMQKDPLLFPLILKFKGLKPPRFPTLFETLINAIAFQQLSLEAGFSLLNKFVERYGAPLEDEDGHLHYAFPEPRHIMNCTGSDLRAAGFSRRKCETIVLIAAAIENQNEAMNGLDELSNAEVIQKLSRLKGIGRWTAEYVLLRGLGRIEIIPGDDVGVHNSMVNLLKLDKKPDYKMMKAVENNWHPYAGLLYFHFLLKKLSESGALNI